MDHAMHLNAALSALRPIVFAYDFPHKKAQDIILRLTALGCPPRAVLAAPRVALDLPPAAMRVKPRHTDLLEPEELCHRLGVEYHVVDHRSESCLMVLDLFERDVGIIAGARMLPLHVIERFPRGVVNFHPGLLPHVRGLDALQWAILRDQPLGVTAHLIDKRVDAGWILERREIPEYPDDTLVDLSLRLYETQLAMLKPALLRVGSEDRRTFERVTGGEYNKSFPAELVPELLAQFEARRRRLRERIPLLRVAT
jgi:folate-dependent phosphoribosylglycinamide formyltransferase PurN